MSTDRTLNGTEPAADQTTSDRDDIPRTGDSLSAERTERRRQRIATRQARTASKPRAGSHRDATTESTNAPSPPKLLKLRDSVSVTSVVVLAAGGVLGAILGALGAAGWVIGLLAAALTVIVSAVLRSYSRSG